MDRIKKLCSYIDTCEVFADVACDHGYCAEYMLKNGLCRKAIISDISEKSLSKAKSLLARFIEEGRCDAVCCDGLERISNANEVLIAGIGGEEIIKILKNAYIPEKFIFQPMKNAEMLRAYLLENNCCILADDILTDEKNYYFVIKGAREGKNAEYSKAQLMFGRDSLNNPVLSEYLKEELAKKKSYLSRNMKDSSRFELQEIIEFIEGVLNGEIN